MVDKFDRVDKVKKVEKVDNDRIYLINLSNFSQAYNSNTIGLFPGSYISFKRQALINLIPDLFIEP